MKTFVAFTLLIAGISALPSNNKLAGVDLRNERLVTDAIASAIEDVSQQIVDAGLDPLHIQELSGSYALPVPVIFNAEGVVAEVLSKGLSNIVINNLNYGILTNRLRFDISLPLIDLAIEKAELKTVFFDTPFDFKVAGTFAIKDINIDGDVRVNIGIISGISIRSIALDFSIDGIQSDLHVVAANEDMSDKINGFLGGVIPSTLSTFAKEINELLEIVALEVINANL